MSKSRGVCISFWVPRADRREYKDLCALVNQSKESGPHISGSFIIRTLLKAYKEGLAVPGLPTIQPVGTTDAAVSE